MHDPVRCSGRYHDASPITDIVLGDPGLIEGRYILKESRALGIRNRQAPQLAVLDVTGNERKRDVQDVGVAGDRRHNRGAATLEWHLHDIEFMRELEQSIDRNMGRRSVAWTCVAVFAWICLQ